MPPSSPKKVSLSEEGRRSFSSLLQQGGVVLVSFAGMLLLTGGAPSSVAIGAIVIFNGAVLLWLERKRLVQLRRLKIAQNLSELLLRFPNPAEKDIQTWLEQTIPEGLSANKTAILRRKLSQLVLETNKIEKIQPLISAIQKSSDNFLELAALAALDPLQDFSKADLSSTNLSTDPSEADLHGANLSETNLSSANLNGINLYQVNLQSANLSKAALSWAYLFDANLQGANLSGAKLYGANLSNANLRRANLSQANLNETKLCGADLSEAKLCGASLQGANLCKTDLRETDLRGADLSKTDLSEANLREANSVQGTRFREALGISLELKLHLQSRGAIFEDLLGYQDKVLAPH
jgi:uncharacterized protein YjbI with pentapeptide repeats